MIDTKNLVVAVVSWLLMASAWAGDDGSRKYNPGHYVALPRYADDPEDIQDSMRSGVIGVQIRYTWRELEPSRDSYDFSAIEEDLALLSESGRQLVVFVCDKSFKDERFTPEYLWNDHTVAVSSQATGTGSISKRWDPYVVERMSKLIAELGAAFDAHADFEGVATQETALGIDNAVLSAEGYTAARYRDALITLLGNAADSLPRSRVFWYANYLPWDQSYLGEVADAVAPVGVAVGGPDVLPEDDPLQNLVYPMLRAQPDDVVVFNSAQFESFRHEHADPKAATKYWTPREIFEFARDDLGVQYLFWNRVVTANPPDSYDIEDAYPVMEQFPLIPGHLAVSPKPPVIGQ